MQRKSHTLAQLILARKRVRDESLLYRINRIVVSRHSCLRLPGGTTLGRIIQREWQVGIVRYHCEVGGRQAELFVEIRPEAHRLDPANFCGGGAK